MKWNKGGCFPAWFATLLSHLCGIVAINGSKCPNCGYKRTQGDDGDVWQVTGTEGGLQLEFWEENERSGWRGVAQTHYYCGRISQRSATEKNNQWQMRILHVVYAACTTSTSCKGFLGAHKCRRTCCDWHEASGLSSHSIYVISVLQTGGAMRSLEWSTLFGLTACSQAADSFWAQDVWVTRHNSGQRENRALKISA